jgi:CBS domain-containing protein
MESGAITSLTVTNSRGKLVGLIHMHDLLRAGIV